MSLDSIARSLNNHDAAMDRAALAEPWLLAAYLDPKFVPQAHQKLMSRELRRWANTPNARLMINTPPQVGKPVYDGSLILMGDGSRKPIREVQAGDTVISHTGRPCPVTAVHEQGTQACITITTASGRRTTAALDHPFLTPEGWVNAGDLHVGQVLATVPRPACQSSSNLTRAEARLMGYFMGDGSATSFQTVITTACTGVDAEIRHCAAVLGFTVNRRDTAGRAWLLTLKGGVLPWLRAHPGIADRTSHTRRVPAAVFTAAPDVIAEFIGGYWDCDGVISSRGKHHDGSPRKDVHAELYAVSRELLQDVQHLLLRLGIRSCLRRKTDAHKDTGRVSWRLRLIARDDVARFRELVRLENIRRAAALAQHHRLRTSFDAPLLPDPVTAVEPAGDLPVRCLTVDNDHTFTSDDLVVHNSTLSVVWTVFWRLCHDPTLKIMILSCAGELAQRHGRDIRELIERHGHRYGLRLRRGSKKVTLFDTDAGGMVRSVGRGGLATGLPADECYVDDTMKDWVEALSKTTRDKAWNWLSAVVNARLGVGGRMAYIGTLWHRDDPAARLLQQAPDAWRVIRLPAFAGPDDPLGRAPGAPLPRPGADENDIPALTRHWQLKQEMTVPAVWDPLYMCNPHRPGLQLITEEALLDCIDRAPVARPLVRAVAVDPSVGELSDSDGSADGDTQDSVGIVAGWLGDDQRVYISHNQTRVASVWEWPELVCRLAHETGASVMYVEDNQGKGLLRLALAGAWQRLHEQHEVHGPMPMVELVTATRAKYERAQIAATFWQKRTARMTDMLPGFIAEWISYRPGSFSPGAVDACGLLLSRLLPDAPIGDSQAASPAQGGAAIARAASAYPWRAR